MAGLSSLAAQRAALLLLLLWPTAQAAAAAAACFSAIYTFGDSTADVGESHYLPNITYNNNFRLPYGESYIAASGRWSNGRLIGDYLGMRHACPLKSDVCTSCAGTYIARMYICKSLVYIHTFVYVNECKTKPGTCCVITNTYSLQS